MVLQSSSKLDDVSSQVDRRKYGKSRCGKSGEEIISPYAIIIVCIRFIIYPAASPARRKIETRARLPVIVNQQHPPFLLLRDG